MCSSKDNAEGTGRRLEDIDYDGRKDGKVVYQELSAEYIGC